MEKDNVISAEEVISTGATKQQNFVNRLWAHLKTNYALFFAPIFVLCIYVLSLYQNGIYPFSDKYTVASYDLSAQICPFIEHLFDVLDGKSSLFYSYAIAGGADVTGTFLYFFISPFSFLFLVLGDGMVTRAAAIVMACKLATTAFAGAWFAKKVFKNIPNYLCAAVGIVYAYCGYMFVANTYINWVDFLIYMPFCAAAFKRFVQTGKFLPFSILMACCIYTCFSIACFSMFIVFPVLIGYALLCVEKEKRNKFIANLCMSFAVTILLALPILVPALMAYANGGRSGDAGILNDLWKGFKDKTDSSPDDFDNSWYQSNYVEAFNRKWSYIFSDSVFLALTLLWMYRVGFKDKFVQFMLLAGVLTLVPVIVDESMVLLNMGSYMSYALRFGFLNALYFLGGACLCLDSLCYKPWRAYDDTPLFSKSTPQKKVVENQSYLQNEGGMYALKEEKEGKIDKKKAWLWIAIIGAIGFVVSLFLLYFTSNDTYKSEDFWGIFMENGKSFSGFSASFAHSLGGLPVILVLFFAVAILTVIGAFFLSQKKISVRALSYILLVVVGIQVLFYNNQMVVGNRSTQHMTMNSYTQLVQQLNEDDDSYFRVKDYSDKLTANAPFTGNANSFSVFSSVIDADNFAMVNLFGYKGNSKNSLKSAHNTDKINRSDEFGDSFLGYKYFFVPKSARSNFAEGKPLAKYAKPYMVTDETGKETHLNDGSYYVYENEIVFPNAYVLPKGDFQFKKPNTANSTYRKYNQQALYEFLRGEPLADMKDPTGSTSSEFVTPETARELSEHLWKSAVEIEVGAAQITATVENATAGECLFLNFMASDGYEVTVNGKKVDLVENDLKFLCVELDEGKNDIVFTYKTPYVKYMAVGVIGGIVGLCAVAFVIKKTKLVDWASPVIAWTAIGLATALVAFFMLYPTVAHIIKMAFFM